MHLGKNFCARSLKEVQGLLAAYIVLRTGHRPGVVTNLMVKELLARKKSKDIFLVRVSQDL